MGKYGKVIFNMRNLAGNPLPQKHPDFINGIAALWRGLDYRNYEEIHQNEFGVTRATDKKPVLVTYGLVSCVGVAGYGQESNTGFLAHYQTNTDVPTAIGVLMYHLALATEDQGDTFNVRVKGGVTGMSEALVDDITYNLTLPKNSPVRFELDDNKLGLLNTEFTNACDLGIDTRTRTFIDSYNAMHNPDRRAHLPPHLMELVFASSSPQVHYAPAS
jgi:hypothetical protein